MIRQVATLAEVEEHWSIVDLMLANEALDLQDEVDQEAARKVGGSR